MLMYLFFKPIAKDSALQEQLDIVFDRLKVEIHTIFNSSPITEFCAVNNIRLKAVYEESEIMEPLTSANTYMIYP